MILGIETSCDETAAGIVDRAGRLRANVVASQATLHAPFGGIVPEVASRQHIIDIAPVVHAALDEAGCRWQDLDAVAATNGPGLAGSLLVGVNFAKGAAVVAGKPFLAVNHLVGHVMAAFIQPPPDDDDASPDDAPSRAADSGTQAAARRHMALIVSGGHTELVLTTGHPDAGFRFRLIGETRDDAAGEAFDKAARTLGLSYPGGPAIQRAAEDARPRDAVRLPRARLGGAPEFSFSGIKTAVIDLAKRHGIAQGPHNAPAPSHAETADADPARDRARLVAAIAHEFQESVVDVLVEKTIAAAQRHRCDGILLVGGVAANRALRERLIAEAPPLPVLVPPIPLCTDNGAMIAMAGRVALRQRQRQRQHPTAPAPSQLDADVVPSLRIA